LRYLTPEECRIAAENGINPQALYHRFYVAKWSSKRAITQSMKPYRIHPEWALQKAKENNIARSTFKKRIRLGWDLNRACTEAINENYKR
jgi:hypothetical protein